MAIPETVRHKDAFLYGLPATERDRRWALIAVLVSISVCSAMAPFANVPMAHLPGFIPAYESALVITDLMTAVLLFAQYSRRSSVALLVLSTAYLFSATMIGLHVLSFPGAFSPTGFLGANDQTTGWLYVFWHLGFPLGALGYALLPRTEQRNGAARAPMRIGLAVASVIVLAALALVLATTHVDWLPRIIHEGTYVQMITLGISPTLALLTVLALLVLLRRRTFAVLDLWIAVVLVAWLLDIGLSAILSTSRFDLGWYGGRAFGLASASVLLVILMVEMFRLYGRVADALLVAEQRNDELVRSREELARAQRLEAVGQLTGGVAHDFNNLLTVITGNLELIDHLASEPEKVRELTHVALRAADRGERLTQQLLTFARRQVTRPEVVNVNRLLSEFDPLLRRAVGESITLSMKLSPVLDPIRIDPAQFESALLNLVVNARDAMPRGGDIAIETCNAVLDADYAARLEDAIAGAHVLVTVRDTGVGMTRDVVAKAFDPFFTTKDVGKGSGLGLSQVYGFVKGSGGHTSIDSKPGGGTTVKLYFPKSIGALSATAPKSTHTPPPRGSETVLVVEDDNDVLAIAVAILDELGFTVYEAQNAFEALAILQSEQPIDLLFSDVVMPGMSGAQLAEEAYKLRPGLKVLLTSGYAAATLARHHPVPSSVEILTKPYRREDLAKKVRQMISMATTP